MSNIDANRAKLRKVFQDFAAERKRGEPSVAAAVIAAGNRNDLLDRILGILAEGEDRPGMLARRRGYTVVNAAPNIWAVNHPGGRGCTTGFRGEREAWIAADAHANDH